MTGPAVPDRATPGYHRATFRRAARSLGVDEARMRKFEGVDFYSLDELLTEEERMIRDTVRSWVDERVLPIIAGHCREGTFPRQLVPEMAELGLLGANLTGYECPGLARSRTA
jgi:alkylation response protein AidB-like acyl-CoA dehydrogenase